MTEYAPDGTPLVSQQAPDGTPLADTSGHAMVGLVPVKAHVRKVRPAGAERMMSVHAPSGREIPTPEQEALGDEGIGPLELATFAMPAAKAAAAVEHLTPGLAKWSASAIRGAASNLGFMLPARASRGRATTLPEAATDLAAGAALGAVAEPVMRAAGNLIRPRVAAAPPATMAEPALVEGPRLPVLKAQGAPESSPFTGRTAQQQTAGMAPTFSETVMRDPDYLARLKDLGGGRVHTNEQTLAQALEAGPLDPEHIAQWKAETPINAVEQTRALVTKDYFQQRFLKALASADDKGADEALAVLGKIEPGVQNIRATGGRTTQAQAMFVQDKVAQAYAELADMRAKGVPFDQVQEAATKKLAELARDQSIRSTGRSVREWISSLETYATAAKLTSPITHAVNSISNALTFMVSRPLEKLGNAAALTAQGNKTAAAAEVRTLFGTTQGFVNGARRFASVIKDGDLGKFSEGAPKEPNAVVGVPFRLLAAADGFWKGVLEDAKLNELAYQSAARQGLTGKGLAKRISELVSDPPQEWKTQAETHAREVTFQEDPDAFLKAIGKLRSVPGMRLIIPFVQTPYNIGKYQFQRSPMGIASPRNLRGLGAGGEAQAEAIGRLASGTALAVAGWSIVKHGEVTGAYPTDAAERALWEAEGRQPYSVKVGGKWLAYNRFAPLGMYLGQAAALNDAIEGGDLKNAGTLFTRLAVQSGKQILDMPFVSGLSSLLDAIQDPERSAGRFASQTVTGLVPNILRDVRIQTDPMRREARGVVPAVRNMVPGASQGLEPKVDILGRDVGYDPSRVVRASKVLSSPRTTVETQAMRGVRYAPTKPIPRLQTKGQKADLEGREATEFQRDMGTATRKAVERISGVAGFAKLEQEEQAKRIKRAVEDARDRVRSQWKHRKFHREVTK